MFGVGFDLPLEKLANSMKMELKHRAENAEACKEINMKTTTS